MDEQRFDELARALGLGLTRRNLLASIGAAAGAMIASTGSALAACRKGGGVCRKNADCCSGTCLGKDSTGRSRCACDGGAQLCAGTCIDVSSDPDNCGGCGVKCPDTTCGSAICSDGVCGVAPRTGSPCVSGDLCTIDDACQEDGTCRGTPISCPVNDDRCASATCDASTGQCVTTNFARGTSCSSTLSCTGRESCDGNGACVSGTPVDCSLLVLDDRCGSAICNEQTGKCEVTLSAVGTSCGSTNPCTGIQTCNAEGICVRDEPIECADQATACQSATCNPTTESCDLAYEPAGTICGEGDLCTGIPSCNGAGTCDAATPKDCSAYESDCSTVTCNPETGVCEVDKKPVGTICRDATGCQAASTCDASGICKPGAGVDCAALSTSCVTASCDEHTGQCVFTNVQNGTACDFGLNCITGGVCQNGVCSSQPKQCFTPVPNDRCARAYCDVNTDQCIVENYDAGTICGDNVTCNGVETCDGTGVCRAVANSGTDCSVLNTDCQTFYCDTQLGQCSFINRPDRTFCDNGDGVCFSGVCKRGGNDFVCVDGSECISGGCFGSTCVTGGNGLACLTDWDCTNACVAGVCSDGALGSACDTTADCINGLECDARVCSVPTYPNGSACTSPDQCDSGACGRIITAADQAISPVCCIADGQGTCSTNSDCCSPQGDPHICLSGLCRPATIGTACTSSVDCPTSMFCDSGTRTCKTKSDFGGTCSTNEGCLSQYQCCSGTCKICCQANNTNVPAFSGCGPGGNKICCDGHCAQVTDTNCGCGNDCTTGTGCNGTTRTATCTSIGVCTPVGLTSCTEDGYCHPECARAGTCVSTIDIFTYARECSTDIDVIIDSYGAVCYSNSDCINGETCVDAESCAGGAGTVFCQSGGGYCD